MELTLSALPLPTLEKLYSKHWQTCKQMKLQRQLKSQTLFLNTTANSIELTIGQIWTCIFSSFNSFKLWYLFSKICCILFNHFVPLLNHSIHLLAILFNCQMLTFFWSIFVIVFAMLLSMIPSHCPLHLSIFAIFPAEIYLKFIQLSSCWNLFQNKAALLTTGIQIEFHNNFKLKAVWLLQYLKIWQIVNHQSKCQANQNVNQPNWALGCKCHLKHLHAPGARFCAPEVQNKYGRRLGRRSNTTLRILSVWGGGGYPLTP